MRQLTLTAHEDARTAAVSATTALTSSGKGSAIDDRRGAAERCLKIMKNFNVGVVGYGWVATAHIPATNATPLAQVTALCSSRKLDAGKEMPLTSLDDAVITHEIVFAADRSAELGRPVKMTKLRAYAR